MERIAKLPAILLLSLGIGVAGPPGGGHGNGGGGGVAHSFSPGPISGPAPVGASGPAPTHAAGNLIGPLSPGYRNGSRPTGPYRNSNVNNVNGNGRANRNNRRAPYALFLAPYATYPYFGYDDTSAFDYNASPDYAPNSPIDPASQSIMIGQDQLGQQVQQLTAELQELKSQGQPNGYAPRPVAPSTADQDQPQNTIPVTLVLQNGQRIQVKNYAVMDGVFWDFSKQPSRKIPLSSINLDASAQATQANGGEFPDLMAKAPTRN